MSVCSDLGDSDSFKGTLGNTVRDKQDKQVQTSSFGCLVRNPRQIMVACT